MIEVPSELTENLPQCLWKDVEHYWQDWIQSCQSLKISSEVSLPLSKLGYVWACSDFAARHCIRKPQDLHDLIAEGLEKERSCKSYLHIVSENITDITDDVSLMSVLRQLRQKEMLRIAFRDLLNIAAIQQILWELSDLADTMIVETLSHLHQQACVAIGIPKNEKGEEQKMVVLAMGKLGGRELNFSSDIDLIFCYVDDGYTQGQRKLSNHEFFILLAQSFIKVLNEVTSDGFVYRVDTRLRPYGKSGPLVTNFNFMEQYYQSQGRDWERYAMIKGRIVAGQDRDKKYLQKMLRPFVYRRYLDFSAFESVREMKGLIESEVQRKGMQDNIKLGKGGIREIEFIGQVFQLIRGGRDPELRIQGLLNVFKLLAEKKYLPSDAVLELSEAYLFLRRLENRIQMERDQQTHVLKSDQISMAKMALAMEYDNEKNLLECVDMHRQNVHNIFQEIVSEQADSENSLLQSYWLEDENSDALQQWLVELGYTDAESEIKNLQAFQKDAKIKVLSDDATTRMLLLLHNFLLEIAEYQEKAKLIEVVLELITSIVRRTVYINLLIEYKLVREHVLKFCSMSHWFARQLISHPLLLDELLDTNELLRVRTRENLSEELDYLLSVVGEDDLEEQMDRLRHFTNAQKFRIAALDLNGSIELMDVGQNLSDVASVVLNRVLAQAWQHVSKRHGLPECVIDGKRIKPVMGIIAYGKMGGSELGYGSDLDIVFLHNSGGEKEYTQGDKSIDNTLFFTRVAQRVLHLMGTRTYAGILYETDVRLRPNGKSGTMVSSLKAYDGYQHKQAWTWEHQALLRARIVAGTDNLGQEFDRIRRSVLAVRREPVKLCADVVEMREKMREHLGSGNPGVFNIKQDKGGIVDIEFIAQLGMLLKAVDDPSALNTTATIAFLSFLGEVSWLETIETQDLIRIYKDYRYQLNKEALQFENTEVDKNELQAKRERVSHIWQRVTAACQ